MRAALFFMVIFLFAVTYTVNGCFYGWRGWRVYPPDIYNPHWDRVHYIHSIFEATRRKNQICMQPIVKGWCISPGVYNSFGYDYKTQDCVPFSYSGCGGNDNRFETYTDCQLTCMT